MFASFVHEFDPVEFRRCHVDFVGQLKHKHLYHLVGEVDRCLKKVGEGVELVEDLWEKFLAATIPSQKEKFESDLKKEIKKLQRLREQIKSWISSADIKDKAMLLDTKKLIETQMERFKGIEREMKIKAYSKIGLESVQKVDPLVQESEELNLCISNWMEELEIQIDHFESEAERLLGTRKRRGQFEEQDRLEQLQSKIERHKFHIKKLETLMKMLDDLGSDVNYSATRIKQFLTEVKNIKDDIDYYISSNDEPDFKENDDIYNYIEGMDEFELSATYFSFLSLHPTEDANTSTTSSESGPKVTADVGSQVEQPMLESIQDDWKVEEQKKNDFEVQMDDKTFQESEYSKAKEDTLGQAIPILKPCFTDTPTSSFKEVVSRFVPLYTNGAVKFQETCNNAPSSSVLPVAKNGLDRDIRDVVSRSWTEVLKSDSESPCPSTSEDSSSLSVSFDSEANIPEKPKLSTVLRLPPPPKAASRRSIRKANVKPVKRSTGMELIPSDDVFSLGIPSLRPGQNAHHHSGGKKEAVIPPLLGAAPLGPVPLGERHRHCFEMLLAAEGQIPMTSCVERLGQVLPRENIEPPRYYPQVPLPAANSGVRYKLVDIETLFFLFYYCEGSMAQYLAAKELKARSWRFHTKYLTWYQREEVPETTTDAYEIGAYIFFDFDMWCQRRTKNFCFEYRYLEDKC